MQLGKTLVGALVGAVLGIGFLVIVYLLFGIDRVWMSIPVAILTGFGVRAVAAKDGRASYLRGAITVLIAMSAYLAGVGITKAVANYRADKVAKTKPMQSTSDESSEPGEAKDEAPSTETQAVTVQPTTTAKPVPSGPMRVAPTGNITWDFLSMAIAALVAYQLGRGSDAVTGARIDTVPSEPIPGGAHPDA